MLHELTRKRVWIFTFFSHSYVSFRSRDLVGVFRVSCGVHHIWGFLLSFVSAWDKLTAPSNAISKDYQKSQADLTACSESVKLNARSLGSSSRLLVGVSLRHANFGEEK